MPDVSIIIPNYNHQSFLARRIDSCLNQTFQNFEIIILDDFSTDNSRQIIEEYRGKPKISAIIYNEKNSGSTFLQWKKGIETAIGKYIWIAESDDYAEPDFLSVLMAPFLKDNELVVSYCRSIIVDGNNRSLGLELHADVLDKVKWTKDYMADGAFELNHYLKYRNTLPNASAVLFKRPKNLNEVLKTNMRYCGDWRFWQNMLKQPSCKIAYTQQPLNYFRTHGKTTRFITKNSNAEAELQRFREYKSFVPTFFINPFDNRFRWMLAEWIERGVGNILKKTHYYYIPLLAPALIMRYYMHRLKMTIMVHLPRT